MRFDAGDERARALAVRSVDLVDHILEWALDPARESNALAFLMSRAHDRVVRTLDFEDALAAYALRKPASRLPALLAAEDGAVVDTLAQQAPADARDLYALWLAGLVRAQHEPGSLRAIPRPAVTPRAPLAKPASDAGMRVAAALLRVRGRAPWQALGLTVGASPESLQLALANVRRDVGPQALAGVDLGDHHAAAKELWELLDDLDVQIAVSGALDTVEMRALADVTPEQAFLDGQIALQRGELRTACAAFETALRAKPNDPDMNAWHAWASILAGDDEVMAMDVLETAARAYPEAMRPVYFLGLAAQRRGDLEQAKVHLADACARAPFDLEVRSARAALA
jgi:tetratricopeptide (TPR) repeat protein